MYIMYTLKKEKKIIIIIRKKITLPIHKSYIYYYANIKVIFTNEKHSI